MSKYFLIHRKKRHVLKFDTPESIVNFLWGRRITKYILVKNQSNIDPDIENSVPEILNGKVSHFPILIETLMGNKKIVESPEDLPQNLTFKVLKTSFNGTL